MDIDTLYNMVKSTARGAERALSSQGGPKETSFDRFIGYPAFVKEYNSFLPFVYKECGGESKTLFEPINLGKYIDPFYTAGIYYKTYLAMASAKLHSLEAYLQSFVKSDEKAVQSIIDLIGMNLRSSIYKKPEKEVEVQNALDTIFRARSLDYKREKDTIEYSSKRFIPDFTFDSSDLSIEVKLCKSAQKEKQIIDEINADIPAYQTRFRRIIFVVFDLGYIRDVEKFKSGIESNKDVYMCIIKM